MTYDEYSEAPHSWTETYLVAIEKEGGNRMLFSTISDTISFDIGEKGMESIATASGGRLPKFSPEADTTISLEIYPLAAGNYWNSTGEEAAGFFDLLHTIDTDDYDPLGGGSYYQSYTNDRTRTRFRMTVMWTNDTSATDATAAIAEGSYAAERITLCGYFTKVEPSFDDDILSASLTMTVPAFKKDGTGNIRIDSTDDSSEDNMPAWSSFTSSTNFD